VLAQNSINSYSIVFLKAWGHCKRWKEGRKEGRKLEYILKVSNSVVVQGRMSVSCYFAAFFGGGVAKKAEIG
jgi:hypothetical protein